MFFMFDMNTTGQEKRNIQFVLLKTGFQSRIFPHTKSTFIQIKQVNCKRAFVFWQDLSSKAIR